MTPLHVPQPAAPTARPRQVRRSVVGFVVAALVATLVVPSPSAGASVADELAAVQSEADELAQVLSDLETELALIEEEIVELEAEAERIRDMHHEKKPLVIRNFLEFLDEATDVSALAARTARQQRQVILLAASLDEDIKTKWIGKENPYGVLFKSGNGVCSD